MKRQIDRGVFPALRLAVRSVFPTLLILLGSVFLTSCDKTPAEVSGPNKDPEKLARERGAQVIAEYLKRDATPYRQTRVRLTISDVRNETQIYELDVWRKQTANETLTLTQIAQPAAQRDLASLTIERQGEDAVNVTYLTANDQFRETGTNKSFFGGVTAQEFLGEWDKYDGRLVNEKGSGALTSYEIEARLKPKRDSTIARLTAVFRGDTYLPAEMHAFNSDGEELRTFRITDYRNFSGRPVVGRMEIKNHIFKTTVIVEVLNMMFPGGMDDSLFTREHLKQIAKR
jgi:Outer membrane lipoprotein-sorting protein